MRKYTPRLFICHQTKLTTRPTEKWHLDFCLNRPILFGEHVLTNDILVDIQDLHFSYGDRPLLQGINMRIPRGKVVAIMGGSGCG